MLEANKNIRLFGFNLKKLSIIFISSLILYFGYKWNEKRKLENYFVEKIALDAYIQIRKGDRNHDGPIFRETCQQMKEQGYNPLKIQKIIHRGYVRGDKDVHKYYAAEAWLAEHKNELEN